MPRIRYVLEIELDIEADVSPYLPAKTYGDPDNCYPEEGGEVDITSVVIIGPELDPKGDLKKSLESLLGMLISSNEKIRDDIESELFEAAENQRPIRRRA